MHEKVDCHFEYVKSATTIIGFIFIGVAEMVWGLKALLLFWRTKFGSQCLVGSSQPPVTLILKNTMPSSGLRGYHHSHAHITFSHTHNILK